MSTLRALFAVCALLALGCGGAPPGGTVKHCFEVIDGAERTLIIVEEGDPAKVTIQDPDGGNKQVTLGRTETGAFVYGDGSRLSFDAKSVRGTGGLIDGIVGSRIACP